MIVLGDLNRSLKIGPRIEVLKNPLLYVPVLPFHVVRQIGCSRRPFAQDDIARGRRSLDGQDELAVGLRTRTAVGFAGKWVDHHLQPSDWDWENELWGSKRSFAGGGLDLDLEKCES
ncbi:hypothetical protein LOK49_LG04G03487 [Camellia lanceoleosa]|uniref:Uncharacterized protein n=1 Tax=Camellia lanceoleosa TaxID=1840588 RepID=A0ACC0I1E0_9ERIC|nr:hypothetical protein LOK49_LG04G03487 [Camellia lanceoleosa]